MFGGIREGLPGLSHGSKRARAATLPPSGAADALERICEAWPRLRLSPVPALVAFMRVSPALAPLGRDVWRTVPWVLEQYPSVAALCDDDEWDDKGWPSLFDDFRDSLLARRSVTQ